MAQEVDVGGPAPQVAALHSRREPLVRGAVAQRSDRDRVVRPTGSVREPQEVEESGVVVGSELRHPAVAERAFELVFVFAGDGMDFVQEQQWSLVARCRVAR